MERKAVQQEKNDKTGEASMLGKDWGERRKRYDFLVVGSGYGGAILAARLSAAIKDSSKTLCLLERG